MTVNHVQNKPLVGIRQSGIHEHIAEAEAFHPDFTTRTFGTSRFTIRVPRFGDFEQWRATRLLHGSFLAPAFGEAARTWHELNTPSAWIEKYLNDRRLSKRGLSYPHLLFEASHSGTTVAGEVNISRVDGLSNAGELSIWCTPSIHRSEVTGWAGHVVALRAFTRTVPLRWVIAPVSVDNPRPAKGLALAGFERTATLRRQRDYAGQPTDHHLWVCENTHRNRIRLQELIGTP
ncbi:GNAT family N-acetyltransferase [Rhodococcoides yunnanense]|uniref:GNAT family N-acetyltransferase n=1 Tax=Rhodococcoides yunnanense TaxID=278209 RepID=UPI000AF74731|nr:GNAT family protein [Rhodococcus yunnanensis]